MYFGHDTVHGGLLACGELRVFSAMRLPTFLLSLSFLPCALLRAEPVPLFDGRTLDGWDYDPKIWRVEDGVITGGSTTEKITANHFIATKRSFQNFELRLKIKCSGDPKTGMINSGIQIRSVRAPGGTHMSGYQVDCGDKWFGKIYDEYRRNKVIAEPLDAAALDKAVDVFGWNEYRIRAEGPRIQVWINGVAALDYTEQDKNIALDGQIAPQVHSGGICLVQVKDVTIEELPPTPGVPTWESLGGVEAARKLVAPPPKKQADATQPIRGGRDISYNDVQGISRTAEEQQKLFHLPEGYEIELVVQESEGLGKFVSVYFDQRGRMWTQTALEYPVDSNENPAAAEAVYAGKGKDKVLVYPRESVNGPIPAGGLADATIFADGLAIPLGILPWGNGDTCYVQHGHDLKLYKDTNGDGRADTFDVVLTGFGVQDSHLFPHQFTRAPGGWIWMAQGLFNHSKVHKPGSDQIVDWPKCSMARMRPDGSEFEVISTGPNNIWGLVITGQGEAFIQEANDYGYPVMPFHEYAYYPGGMEALKKSYQPDFPPAADFRMGGTGLSGLALIESGPLKSSLVAVQQGNASSAPTQSVSLTPPSATPPAHVMAVANPITSKVQTIAMHRDGPYWKLAQLPDLITCDDPFFRPVGLTNGPDGCIYITDWYNKIISHNEVPRAHPDRDKTRGRIWRVKPKARAPGRVADFTKLGVEELLAMLDKEPVGRAHLAWQTLADKGAHSLSKHDAGRWQFIPMPTKTIADQIRLWGRSLPEGGEAAISTLLSFARPSLPGPLAQSSRGPKQIPVREAYDREFERFLVRMFLERHPDRVAQFLDSDAAAKLPIEARVLAALSLEPKTSAARVAKLLPQMDREPNEEELLRLAEFPEEPGVGDALKALLMNVDSREVVAKKLLAQRTKLNAAQIAPLLTEPVREMLQSLLFSDFSLALSLISGFQITGMEDHLMELLAAKNEPPREDAPKRGLHIFQVVAKQQLLQTLRDLHSPHAEVFATLARSDPDALVRAAALEALVASRAPHAGARFLELFPDLKPAPRKTALATLASTKAGATAIVAALLDKRLPQEDLDGVTVERLATVLGDSPDMEKLQQLLGGTFKEVLLLDGQDTAWVDSKITLEGPFTIESWVRLAPNIGNGDSLLGSPGKIDLNFFASKFRVWIGEAGLHDVCVSTKPMTPDLWTHLAVTRDEKGVFRIYQNGELDATGTKTCTAKIEDCRIGWSGPKTGTEGALCEFRVWKKARTAAEIRASFDRSGLTAAVALTKLGKGARLAKTIDAPPLLTEAQAQALDAKFARLTALAGQGDPQKGKALSALCIACHQIGSTGGQIGPNLSGAGAMGLEAVLRNILTPNAAMEPGYRIYRVEMSNGDLIDAFFVSEDKTAIVIRQPGQPDRRLDKKDIRSTKFIRRSLMPEGLLDALPDQSAADLLAYLMTLRG